MSEVSSAPAPIRRILLAVTGISVLALLLFFVGVFVPHLRQLKREMANVERQEARAREEQVSLDQELLEKILRQAQLELNGDEETGTPGVMKIADDAVRLAGSFFEEVCIRGKFTDTNDFIKNATRLDCKDLSDRLAVELATVKLQFKEPLPGTAEGEEDATPPYQVLCKLWAMQEFFRQARKAGLVLQGSDKAVAQMHPLAPVAYAIPGDEAAAGDAPPEAYLLEFPVRMHLRGTMEQFRQFCQALQNGKVFMPVKSLCIYTLPPAAPEYRVQQLGFKVICSAFLPLL